MSNVTKRNRCFNHAFEFWTGKKWEWTKKDGTRNDPMESDDDAVKAFYTGFCLARNGQKELLEEIKKLENIKREIKDMDRRLKSFRNDQGCNGI